MLMSPGMLMNQVMLGAFASLEEDGVLVSMTPEDVPFARITEDCLPPAWVSLLVDLEKVDAHWVRDAML